MSRVSPFRTGLNPWPNGHWDYWSCSIPHLLSAQCLATNGCAERLSGCFNLIVVVRAGLHSDPTDRDALIEQLERDGAVDEYVVAFETLDGEPFRGELTLRLVSEGGEEYLDGIGRR